MPEEKFQLAEGYSSISQHIIFKEHSTEAVIRKSFGNARILDVEHSIRSTKEVDCITKLLFEICRQKSISHLHEIECLPSPFYRRLFLLVLTLQSTSNMGTIRITAIHRHTQIHTHTGWLFADMQGNGCFYFDVRMLRTTTNVIV